MRELVTQEQLEEICELIKIHLLDKKSNELLNINAESQHFLFSVRNLYLNHVNKGFKFWFSIKQYKYFKDLIERMNDPEIGKMYRIKYLKQKMKSIKRDIADNKLEIEELKLMLKETLLELKEVKTK